MLVAVARGRRVGGPSVGDDATARLDVGLEERGEALCARVRDDPEPCTAKAVLFELNCGCEQDLSERTTTRDPGLWTAEVALVDLDLTAQPGAALRRSRCSVARLCP